MDIVRSSSMKKGDDSNEGIVILASCEFSFLEYIKNLLQNPSNEYRVIISV